MNNDLIERLAREAGFYITCAVGREPLFGTEHDNCTGELQRFASLVAEECAKVADNTSTVLLPTGSFLSKRCGAAIRAKFKEST